MKQLARQIRQLNPVAIDDSQGPDTCGCQHLCSRTTQSTCTDNANPGL
jgi:hypothetical protein